MKIEKKKKRKTPCPRVKTLVFRKMVKIKTLVDRKVVKILPGLSSTPLA